MSSSSLRRLVRTVGLVAVAALGLGAMAACSSDTPSSGGGKIQVVTSFYPLTYVVQNIGGDLVEVTDLTPAGGDAHDLELSPSQVSEIGNARAVVFLGGGFQPSVEQAVSVQGVGGLDAMSAVPEDLLLPGDSHIWLNPAIMGDIGQQVAKALAEADPAGAEVFADNAKEFSARMTALDQQFVADLEGCQGATLVTSHQAFGYLADAYGMEQVGITGINPEAEPSPKRLREVQKVIEGRDVTTLFFEKATAAGTEAKLADSLGVASAQLNPLEGTPSDGADYTQIMEENLQALQKGLNCQK